MARRRCCRSRYSSSSSSYSCYGSKQQLQPLELHRRSSRGVERHAPVVTDSPVEALRKIEDVVEEEGEDDVDRQQREETPED